MEEYKQDIEGYRSELQYSQLQPRNIDPDTILWKSEGELMRTFEAKNLMGPWTSSRTNRARRMLCAFAR